MSKRDIPTFLANQTAFYMQGLPGCRAYWTTIADLNNIRIFYEKPNGAKSSQLFPRLDDQTLTAPEKNDNLTPVKEKQKQVSINNKFFSNE